MAKAKKAAKKKSAPKKAAKKSASKKSAKRAAPKKAAKKSAAKRPAKKKTAAKKAKRKPNAAFMAPLTPSPTLAAVIGNRAMPRTEIVKKIWDYIKANKLQDQKNKRMINTDDKLRAVFNGKKQVSMFEVAKAVNNNVKK